jgi:hypothetical protein
MILTTGGSGSLGRELLKLNPEIIHPTHEEMDVVDYARCLEVIKKHNPSVVIHAAAVTDNRIVEKDCAPAIRTNIVGTANLSIICAALNIRFVYVSTDYVYFDGSHGNYKETDPVLPFNLYSWTKLGGECSARAVKNHLIIRTSFGSDFPYSVAFVDKWSSKDYVDRIAPLIYEAAISPLTGVLNIGTERKTLYNHAKERNPNVKPIKLSETSFFTPYDTSLNLQKWKDYESERSICNAHTKCRACDCTELIKYLDLGLMPLCNNLEMTSKDAKAANRYPLQVMLCEDCGLSQLSVVIDPVTMFSNYVYRSSVNRPYVEHCRSMAKSLKKYGLDKNSFHVDIAGNDGTLLKEFKEEIGLRVLNIDPAFNLAAIAEAQGIPTIADFWSREVGLEIVEKHGHADLITATNVFAHVDNIEEFLTTARDVLADEGVLVIECPYIVDYLEKMEYNQTYFEHLSYMSVAPIYRLCKRLRMKIIDVQKHDIHGGTIRVIISKDDSIWGESNSVNDFLKLEKERLPKQAYLEWSEKVKENIADVGEQILKLKREGNSIIGIGASAKGNTLLNSLGFTTDIIDVIVDETSEKIGKFSPGTGIPIVHKRYFAKNKPDYVLILAENFKDALMKKASEAGFDGKFILSIPKFEVVN